MGNISKDFKSVAPAVVRFLFSLLYLFQRFQKVAKAVFPRKVDVKATHFGIRTIKFKVLRK